MQIENYSNEAYIVMEQQSVKKATLPKLLTHVDTFEMYVVPSASTIGYVTHGKGQEGDAEYL